MCTGAEYSAEGSVSKDWRTRWVSEPRAGSGRRRADERRIFREEGGTYGAAGMNVGGPGMGAAVDTNVARASCGRDEGEAGD